MKSRRSFDLEDLLGTIVEWTLKIVLAPIWLPLTIQENREFRRRVHPLIDGTIEDAWKQCSHVWIGIGRVHQPSVHDDAGFGHDLAVALVERHKTQRSFFLRAVADDNPLLAAYAFKCLIRTGKLNRDEMPAGAMTREELVTVCWADLGEDYTLGRFFDEWFRELK